MSPIKTGHAEEIPTRNETPTSGVMGIRDGRYRTARVPISSLRTADSPRLTGENAEHARALAESDAMLPPIIVHRPSLRVIDGMHRLRAAMIRGRCDIDVLFFEGDEKDAFIIAVKANVTHGLPLSLADRRAAAARILRSHPQWSDRMIAKTAGLSPKTVGAIRARCSTEDSPRLKTRVGRDGRTRPVSGADGRRIASEFIADNPDASLRKIAEVAGISPATARDVRKRVRECQDPALPARRDGELLTTPGSSKSVLLNLKRDPSLRFTEAGRVLLRLLDAHTIDPREWLGLIDNVPVHCASVVADLARECAEAWYYVAAQVELRGHMSAEWLSG